MHFLGLRNEEEERTRCLNILIFPKITDRIF